MGGENIIENSFMEESGETEESPERESLLQKRRGTS